MTGKNAPLTRIRLQKGKPLVKRGEVWSLGTCIRGLQKRWSLGTGDFQEASRPVRGDAPRGPQVGEGRPPADGAGLEHGEGHPTLRTVTVGAAGGEVRRGVPGTGDPTRIQNDESGLGYRFDSVIPCLPSTLPRALLWPSAAQRGAREGAGKRRRRPDAGPSERGSNPFSLGLLASHMEIEVEQHSCAVELEPSVEAPEGRAVLAALQLESLELESQAGRQILEERPLDRRVEIDDEARVRRDGDVHEFQPLPEPQVLDQDEIGIGSGEGNGKADPFVGRIP